jgi:hypothetical protein
MMKMYWKLHRLVVLLLLLLLLSLVGERVRVACADDVTRILTMVVDSKQEQHFERQSASTWMVVEVKNVTPGQNTGVKEALEEMPRVMVMVLYATILGLLAMLSG